MEIYFSGKKLYGDDFSLVEIKQWFEAEKEGYANLGAKDRRTYTYGYHALNRRHGFFALRGLQFEHALGIGSAYADEFEPIARQIGRLTILEPSDAFANRTEVHGVPCKYVKPDVSGTLPFGDSELDLIVALGVMHHIPNISHVMEECARCLRPGGKMVLREPIVSMGDWRRPRPGLTRHERGIPLSLFREIIQRAGLSIWHERLCIFPLLPKIIGRLGIVTYNSPLLVWLDDWLCRLFSWNTKYHRVSVIDKLGPASVFYVLEK